MTEKEKQEEIQREKIYEYMLEGNRITALLALKLFRCMRLGARIYELKKRGVPVLDRYITVEDRETGKWKRVKEYWLEVGVSNGNM